MDVPQALPASILDRALRLSRSRAGVVAGVVLLTAAALALRLHGIGFGLPQMLESDGGIIVRQVMLMHGDGTQPELEASWTAYPHLVARAIALFPDAEKWELASNDLAGHLRAAAAPHLQARIGVAILSVLLVPGTWLLARRFLSRGGAFFAAAAAGTSLLAVWFAQQSRPHGPAAAAALFAVLAALRLRERPGIGSYALAGLAAGAAIGTLQSGVAVLFPLCAAHWLRRRERPGERRWQLLIALALAALVSGCFYPFLLQPSGSAEAPVFAYTGPTFEFFGHSIFLGMFNGAGFGIVGTTLWCFESVAVLLAGIGLCAWLFGGGRLLAREYWRSRPDLCVVLAYALPYLVVIGMYERTYERFALQLLPFLFALAAFGALRCASWLRAVHAPRFAVLAGAAVLLGLPAFGTARLVHLRAEPDSATLVARWIEEHVEPEVERVLIVPFIDFPLWRTEKGLAEEATIGWVSPWQRYQTSLVGHPVEGKRYDLRFLPLTVQAYRELALADPLALCRQVHAKYVAVPMADSPQSDRVRPQLLEALRKVAERVLRVPADARGEPGEPMLLSDDMRGWPWFRSLLGDFSATGYVTEIYRIP